MDFAKLMQDQLDVMTALLDAAKADGNRNLKTDEQEKFDAAETEFKRLQALDKQNKAVEQMKNSIPEPKQHEPASMSNSAGAGVQVGKDLSSTKPYNSFGDMLNDVAKTSIGAPVDKGLAADRLKNANLNTGTGADGGYLIPTQFIGGMMEEAISQSKLYSQVNEIPMTVGNTAIFPGVKNESRADGQRWGGISVQWAGEGSTGDYTKAEFESRDLKLSKLIAFTKVTEEMLEDAPMIDSWIKKAYPSEMAFTLDQAVWDGDGNGKPLGFMNSDALVTVAKESGQTADTIVYENIVKMFAALDPRGINNAKWYVTPRALEQLPLMNLTVGTGGLPVYLPTGGASVAPYGTLMGRPVEVIEQANKLGDKGDIVLADLSDYISIVKGGIKTAESIHVDFASDIMAYRFVKRVNGTPYTRTKIQSRADSTFYTSPYITLAERA